MTEATLTWSIWQALLAPFAWTFTRPGFHRFVDWLTGLALNVEEHTITQSLIGLERTDDWKALEAFAEYGAWNRKLVEVQTARQIETAPGRLWYGYRVEAIDDTKIHRNSPNVWGTCTFHEYSARSPNRATTVRAHNWVVVGALLVHNPGLSRPGSYPRPVGCTSASPRCRSGTATLTTRTLPHQRATSPWNCCATRPKPRKAVTWGSSTALSSRWPVWSGPWSCCRPAKHASTS